MFIIIFGEMVSFILKIPKQLDTVESCIQKMFINI